MIVINPVGLYCFDGVTAERRSGPGLGLASSGSEYTNRYAEPLRNLLDLDFTLRRSLSERMDGNSVPLQHG
jgi:hypothetical protein